MLPTEYKNLFGCWKLTAMKFLNCDGDWEHEQVLGGAISFTESGSVTNFSRTSDNSFGYSGSFGVNGDEITLNLEACSIPEWEATPQIRTVKNLTPDTLTLSMFDDATGRVYEIDFRLLTRKFVA